MHFAKFGGLADSLATVNVVNAVRIAASLDSEGGIAARRREKSWCDESDAGEPRQKSAVS